MPGVALGPESDERLHCHMAKRVDSMFCVC